mgnify:CR=1 FL=1
MRTIELNCSIIDRIDELNMSTAEKRVAIENLLRAERFAALLLGLAAGLRKLAYAVILNPVRRVVAQFSRSAS